MPIDPQRDFGTRECPSCGVQVAANENRCPICRYPFPARTPLRTWRIPAAVLLLILFLSLIL